MDKEQLRELQEVSKRATLASDLAKTNIEKYLELHHDENLIEVNKPLVMKIAEDADAELKNVVDTTVKAAISNLQRYLELKQQK